MFRQEKADAETRHKRFGNAAVFRYFGTELDSQNFVPEEKKNKFRSLNDC